MSLYNLSFENLKLNLHCKSFKQFTSGGGGEVCLGILCLQVLSFQNLTLNLHGKELQKVWWWWWWGGLFDFSVSPSPFI